MCMCLLTLQVNSGSPFLVLPLDVVVCAVTSAFDWLPVEEPDKQLLFSVQKEPSREAKVGAADTTGRGRERLK